MGNKQSKPRRHHLKCYKCQDPLPINKSAEKRNQYIEGSEYIVHKCSNSKKYFQLVDSKEKCYCFECMFSLKPDPFQCNKETVNVEEERNQRYDQTDASYGKQFSRPSLNIKSTSSREEYLNVNATIRSAFVQSKIGNTVRQSNIQDKKFEGKKGQFDKHFYELHFKRICVEHIPLYSDVHRTFSDKLAESNKNNIDRVLVLLFQKYIQKVQHAQFCLVQNISGCLNSYLEPKCLHYLRKQLK